MVHHLQATTFWARIRQLQEEDISVAVTVESVNKGGMLVKFGIYDGFIPVSQFGPVRRWRWGQHAGEQRNSHTDGPGQQPTECSEGCTGAFPKGNPDTRPSQQHERRSSGADPHSDSSCTMHLLTFLSALWPPSAEHHHGEHGGPGGL